MSLFLLASSCIHKVQSGRFQQFNPVMRPVYTALRQGVRLQLQGKQLQIISVTKGMQEEQAAGVDSQGEFQCSLQVKEQCIPVLAHELEAWAELLDGLSKLLHGYLCLTVTQGAGCHLAPVKQLQHTRVPAVLLQMQSMQHQVAKRRASCKTVYSATIKQLAKR